MIYGVQDITFDGRSLTEYGCVITEPPKRPFPKRKYEKQSVYGRSGDLIVDSESYENFSLNYKVATIPDLYDYRFVDEVLTDLKEWLCSSVSYRKLYDTELPDGFYYAFCSGISDAVCTFDDMYEFEIAFDCKPFFCYDSGQDEIITTDHTISLFNIGTIASKPVIQIYGSGVVGCYVNGSHFTISDVSPNVTVDSELQLVYKDQPDNSDLFSGEYPELAKGDNTITFLGNGYEFAKIIPRWCRL